MPQRRQTAAVRLTNLFQLSRAIRRTEALSGDKTPVGNPLNYNDHPRNCTHRVDEDNNAHLIMNEYTDESDHWKVLMLLLILAY